MLIINTFAYQYLGIALPVYGLRPYISDTSVNYFLIIFNDLV